MKPQSPRELLRTFPNGRRKISCGGRGTKPNAPRRWDTPLGLENGRATANHRDPIRPEPTAQGRAAQSPYSLPPCISVHRFVPPAACCRSRTHLPGGMCPRMSYRSRFTPSGAPAAKTPGPEPFHIPETVGVTLYRLKRYSQLFFAPRPRYFATVLSARSGT